MNHDELHRALRLLRLWRTVRSGSSWLGLETAQLKEAELVSEVITAIGPGLVLSRRGAAVLGQRYSLPSETVVANTLYQQDSWPALQQLGFDLLTPGRGSYRNLRKKERSYPMLGRFTGHGYDNNTITHHWEKLQPDLLARGVQLTVIHPEPERIIQRPRLLIVRVEPRWQ